MTVEEALVILEASLEGGRLNRIQELVFRQVWEGQSYSEIATKFGYDAGYIKNVASGLWRILSQRLGEKVTKNNLQSVLKRRPYLNPELAIASGTTQTSYKVAFQDSSRDRREEAGTKAHSRNECAAADCNLVSVSEEDAHKVRGKDAQIGAWKEVGGIAFTNAFGYEGGNWGKLDGNSESWRGTDNILDFPAQAIHRYQDWGEAIDTSLFYGRTAELNTLEQWIVNERCRLVALLGMGGIGKTALSVKLAQQLEHDFDYVIWRSLLSAPTLQALLQTLIPLLDSEYRIHSSERREYSVSKLIELLRKRRCLIVLDQVESILSSGEEPNADNCTLPAGCYRQGYEGYGELFKQIGEGFHQSCLVITSREKPKNIAILEGHSRPVRSFKVRGLGLEAKELLQSKDISSSDDETQKLLEFYDGNPLILMIVSEIIFEIYQGNVSNFLEQNLLFFHAIGEIVEQHLTRLSTLEKELIHWLSIHGNQGKWVSNTDWFDNIPLSNSRQIIVETLCSLCRRSLIEVSEDESVRFPVNPLVTEYIHHQFIKKSSGLTQIFH